MSRRAAVGGLICAAFGATAPAWSADTLASAATYGGPAQKTVTCLYSNAGNGAVTISDYRILTTAGASVPPRATTCGRSASFNLAPRASCFIAASVAVNDAHACRVSAPSKTNLRGTIEVRDDTGVVLNSLPLQ